MKLKKLTLHNYKQHPHLEVAFTGNVIGVVGRNGSGKSNFLGGIQFAFAGEQPGFKRADLLRWGTDGGFVELEFEHNGIQGHIRRDLVANSATFTFGDQSYRGIAKVGEAIQQHLSIDKDLSKQAIFVRQAEIDAILFEDPRERELAFQKLCGIGEAAKIHKRMGEELAKLNVPPNYDIQIADARVRYDEMQLRLKQLQATSASTQVERDKLPSTYTLQNQIVIQLGGKNLLANQANLIKSAQAEMIQLEKAEKALSALPPQTADVMQLDTAIAELEHSITLADDYERKGKAWEQAGKALMALGDPPKPPALPFTDAQVADLSEKAEAYRQAFGAASANYRMYADLSKALKDTPLLECPVCGGPIKDLQRIRNKMEEYQAQLTSIQSVNYPAQHLHAVQKQEEFRATYDACMTRYNTKYATLLEQFQKSEEAMKAAPQMAEASMNLRARLVQLKTLRQEAINVSASAGLYKNTIEGCRSRLATIQTGLKDLESQLAPFKATTVERIDAELAQLQERMKLIIEFDKQLAALNGMIKELSINLQSLETTIKLLEDKRMNMGGYIEATKVLAEVRDWFHYGNGPHMLAQAVLAEMNQDVNNFLGQFAAPFSVIQGSDALGFRCIFHDGRNMPPEPPEAYHLSGGQKIQLAIAFRFASYCMFANKLGLLSLDEPTVYLDDQNVGAFCTLLQKIKEVAQKMDLQVLIATHERAVMPFIDTVVNLSDAA